eukprot:CAMPEP_0179874458 /NCGR_PEP_ID=MMETSP0982-20121206/22868_1 /TAXON_ID=483367 /ORGANISM="non described non described, Strain CCMP 2436" /LENGTH=77 /DNA_ID=CAMNT_0021766193 /DNA_START=1 /DNA_END=230 /DNA_ORIENTATION=+
MRPPLHWPSTSGGTAGPAPASPPGHRIRQHARLRECVQLLCATQEHVWRCPPSPPSGCCCAVVTAAAAAAAALGAAA